MAGSASIFNGSISIAQARQTAAALGKYFVATNPTPGTGVTTGTVTAFSATADGLFTVYNGNPASAQNPVNIQLDYIALHLSGTAPTATTVMKMATYVESVKVTPTAGNVVVAAQPLLPNGGATQAIINGFTGSAMMTIPAAVGTRTLVGNTSLPTSLGITGDSYVFYFGSPIDNGSISTAVRSTAAARLATNTTPVTIPPGFTAIIDWWWLTMATNGATFDYELAYFEQ